MSAKKPNELIDRYEEMLRGTVSCYFDTDEIDEISDYYESKGQLSKALHAIEFGLNLHPDNVDLKLKEARYMLYLDRADEAKRIMKAQASRGADFNEGSFMGKIKSIISLIIPLFISAFQRAEELANAMESRNYNPEATRTKYKVLTWTHLDTLSMLITLGVCCGVIIMSFM